MLHKILAEGGGIVYVLCYMFILLLKIGHNNNLSAQINVGESGYFFERFLQDRMK